MRVTKTAAWVGGLGLLAFLSLVGSISLILFPDTERDEYTFVAAVLSLLFFLGTYAFTRSQFVTRRIDADVLSKHYIHM